MPKPSNPYADYTTAESLGYKDPDEDGSRSRMSHDRSAAAGQGSHASGKNSKQKMYSQQRSSGNAARASSQDALIGISYEGTKQGDRMVLLAARCLSPHTPPGPSVHRGLEEREWDEGL